MTTSPASSRRSPARPLPAALAGELHARAGGNPFFVEELFAARRDRRAQVPATVADAVALRTAALSERARELLAVVAAAGGQTSHAVLERCEPGPGLGPALRETLDAGLLVRDRDGEGVALRHGLIGEVIYDALIPAERTALHEAIAAALQRRARPRRSSPTSGSAPAPTPSALAASLEAGAQAARAYAFAEASAQYERALTLWDAVRPQDGDRVDLLSRAAQAARYSGDQPRALALGRAALDGARPRRRPVRAARLYERLGEYHSWDDAAALDCYASALALLPARRRRRSARACSPPRATR